MAYTALKEMKERNQHFFNDNAGPVEPEKHYSEDDYGLKALALCFLHERCQGLCFDDEITAREKLENKYYGTSLFPNQIPYNMQMDINRLCLERELEKFIDSGVTEDAYTIYYCYLKCSLDIMANQKDGRTSFRV